VPRMVFEKFSWVGIGGSGDFYRARGEVREEGRRQ